MIIRLFQFNFKCNCLLKLSLAKWKLNLFWNNSCFYIIFSITVHGNTLHFHSVFTIQSIYKSTFYDCTYFWEIRIFINKTTCLQKNISQYLWFAIDGPRQGFARMVKSHEEPYWPDNLSLFSVSCEHYGEPKKQNYGENGVLWFICMSGECCRIIFVLQGVQEKSQNCNFLSPL